MNAQNVAFNKTILMSTEYLPTYHGARFAVDGNVVQDRTGVQCSTTDGELNPWILIDLGATYNPKYVTLFNRIDALGKMLVILSRYC
jgi:hypothetical protein